MDQGIEVYDLVRLRDHVAACYRDDPSDLMRDENLLRHVRVAIVETEQARSRAG